jgi:hypothetical protein
MNAGRLLIRGALLLPCLLAACSTRPAETARNRWYEARTTRFRIWTDGQPEAARKLLADLERFHQVMIARTNAEEHEAAPPLRLVVSKDKHSYVSLTGDVHRVGLFVARAGGNYAIVDGSPRGGREAGGLDASAILFHEYTHYLMAASNARVPSWYDEGFATYMEATGFRADGSYTVGCPPRYHTAWARRRSWLPIEQVFGSSKVSELDSTGVYADSYAQSWYAVHYFNADAKRRAQLAQYLQSWANGMPVPEAVQSAFGMNTAQLDGLLRNYALKQRFSCSSITPASRLVVPQIELRAISEGEAHRHVGELVLATKGPSEAAFEVLERAAKLQPNDAPTLLALARAHWLRAIANPGGAEADLSSAERYVQQANARASGTAEGLLLEAQLSWQRTQRLAEQKQPFAERLLATRKSFRQTIRKDETLAEAYYGLGSTYLLDDNGSDEAIVALEAAAYLSPLATEIALALGRIHVQRKSALQALAAFEYVLRWSRDDEQRKSAQSALDQLRADAASPPPAAEPAVEPATEPAAEPAPGP